MIDRARNCAPIYGPIYEAHDFCTVGFWQGLQPPDLQALVPLKRPLRRVWDAR